MQNHLQHQKVIAYVDSVVTLSKSNENCKYVLALLNLKGLALEYSQKFEESSAVLTQVISAAQKYRHYDVEAKSYLTLARVHDFLKRESDLKRNLLQAKRLIDDHSLHFLLPEYYVRKSSCQRFFGSRDSSLYFASQAAIWGEKFNDNSSLADANLLLGVNNRENEKAVPYMVKSCDYFKKTGANSSVALQYINVIKILNAKGKISESGQYIDSARTYLKNLEKTPRVYDINEYLCELICLKFEQEGRSDSALYYAKLAHAYSDSSSFATNQQYISDKEVEIATLKEKTRIGKLTRSRSYWIAGFVLLFISILIMSYLFPNMMRFQKQISDQKEEILKQKNDLDQLLTKQTLLLSEVHHRVKNNLQVVISLLSLKGQSSNDSELNRYFDDICMKIRSISLIHEQLYSSNQYDKIHVKFYVQRLMGQFANMTSCNGKCFSIRVPDHLSFNIETLFPIGLILTELIMNSFKHADLQAGNSLEIKIEIKESGDDFLLCYSDNGKGKTSDKSGFGSTILKSMSRQLNGKSEEFNGQGYHYNMQFNEKIISEIKTAS